MLLCLVSHLGRDVPHSDGFASEGCFHVIQVIAEQLMWMILTLRDNHCNSLCRLYVPRIKSMHSTSLFGSLNPEGQMNDD
jgi:hypothetical protein